MSRRPRREGVARSSGASPDPIRGPGGLDYDRIKPLRVLISAWQGLVLWGLEPTSLGALSPADDAGSHKDRAERGGDVDNCH